MAKSAISVIVGATITPLQKQLKKGVGLVKDFGKSASKAIAGGGGLGGAIAGAIGGVTVAAAAKLAIDSFKEVETAAVKLQSTLKAGGNVAGVTTGQVVAFAKQMQATTGISVSASMEAAAAVAKVQNIKGPNFQETIKQAANMAAVLGGDVVSASTQLAGALKNPKEGYLELAAAGVQFSDAQIDTIQTLQNSGDMLGSQAALLAAVKAQYEGAAEAAGGTLDGSINKLWGSMQGLAATVGEALAPYMQAAIGLMQDWASSLDLAAVKATAIEYTATAVGWVVDGMQILNAAFQTGQAVVGALVSICISGFKYATKAVLAVVEALEMIPGTSKTASAGIKSFIQDVEAYETASWNSTKESAIEAAEAWQKPWQSETTSKFFDKVTEQTKKTEEAMKGVGDAIKKGPVDGMKQLSAEAIEAQKSATGMIKEMKQQLQNFGLADWESKANDLAKKGATKGQVADVRKLGALLEGKQLAQSLETPFQTFEREAKKLESLAKAGGIGGDDLAKAKGKLVADLQSKMPDGKIQAGGALQAGSAEARSAIMNYKSQSRNADPAVALARQSEIQTEELKQQTRYLRELAKGRPQVSGFSAM